MKRNREQIQYFETEDDGTCSDDGALIEEERAGDLEPGADNTDDRVTALEAELAAARADFYNYRQRVAREKQEARKRTEEDVVTAFLPVLDNLYRAVDSGCTDPGTVTEGLKLTLKSYEDALKQMGVEEIPALGETFNPELHSAVMHIDDDSFGEGEIVEVFGKGYQRGGRVIRHSIVKVAN